MISTCVLTNRRGVLLVVVACAAAVGCMRHPHIVRNPGNLEDRKVVSAPTLGHPIYACGSSITVQNFLPGATIDVFINNAPAPNPSFIGQIPTPGQTHNTGTTFTAGMVIHVT